MSSAHAHASFTATRRSLITRLKSWDDQAGWQRFFDTYWKLLFAVARRAGLNEADAEDVVQETVVAVARQMPNFRYDPARGSFKNWLLVIVRRRVIHHLRKGGRQPRIAAASPETTHGTDPIERIPDPDGSKVAEVWDGEWQEHLLDAARERIKKRVDPRHLQIFDCSVQGWTIEDIERAFNVTAGHIYTIKHRVAAQLKSEVERLETEMI